MASQENACRSCLEAVGVGGGSRIDLKISKLILDCNLKNLEGVQEKHLPKMLCTQCIAQFKAWKLCLDRWWFSQRSIQLFAGLAAEGPPSQLGQATGQVSIPPATVTVQASINPGTVHASEPLPHPIILNLTAEMINEMDFDFGNGEKEVILQENQTVQLSDEPMVTLNGEKEVILQENQTVQLSDESMVTLNGEKEVFVQGDDNTSDDEEFVCDVCSKVLKSNRTLRHHLKLHQAELDPAMKRHVCQECGQKFIAIYRLKQHMKTHNRCRGERIILRKGIPCPICPKSKKMSYAKFCDHFFKKHCAVPMRCTTCDTCGLDTSISLFNHVFERHVIQKLVCSQCEHEESNPAMMMKHRKATHGDDSQMCEICGQLSYSLRSHYVKHLKPSIQCPNCHVKLKHKSALVRHLKNKHHEAGNGGPN